MRDARFGGLACLLAFASVLLAASVRVDYPSAEVPSERTSEASVAWLQASGGSAPSVSCALQRESVPLQRALSRPAPRRRSKAPLRKPTPRGAAIGAAELLLRQPKRVSVARGSTR